MEKVKKDKKKTEVNRSIDSIREYIIQGEFEEGKKFPSEASLAERLGVSRLTVREALTVLESEGYIAKRQGSSTTVTSFARKLTGKIDKAGDLGSLITSSGHRLRVDDINWAWEPSTAYEAKALNITPGEELLVVRKRFLAGETPAAYCVNRIPRKYMDQVEFSVTDLAEQIYSFIEAVCDVDFSHDFMELIPSITDEKLSNMLQLDMNTPLLRFDITKLTFKGEPIMFNTDYYVHDLIKFTAGRTVNK